MEKEEKTIASAVGQMVDQCWGKLKLEEFVRNGPTKRTSEGDFDEAKQILEKRRESRTGM